MSKPEDISVILGRIRENAERIVNMHEGHQHCEDIDRAQRILELVEQAQKVVLEAQLTASLGGKR